MASLSLAQLHLAHETDRSIFRRLLINLRRNPYESLLVMALWMWLEGIGYPNITQSMVNKSDNILDAFANEGVLSLNCLSAEIPAVDGGRLPLTAGAAGRDISLANFSRTKYTVIYYIKQVLHNVCPWVFSDIILQVLRRPNNNLLRLEGPFMLTPITQYSTFGAVELVIRPPNCIIPISGLWGWQLERQVPREERTIFLTFSHGFPVYQFEVIQLFTNRFGNCIEALKMDHGQPHHNKQSLFCKMVVHSIADVDRILAGHFNAKFRIHGKHIWARKYERREHGAA